MEHAREMLCGSIVQDAKAILSRPDVRHTYSVLLSIVCVYACKNVSVCSLEGGAEQVLSHLFDSYPKVQSICPSSVIVSVLGVCKSEDVYIRWILQAFCTIACSLCTILGIQP